MAQPCLELLEGRLAERGRWGRTEPARVEERAAGWGKAEESAAPGRLGVEVSAEGHQRPLDCPFKPAHFLWWSDPSSLLPRGKAL